MTNRLPEDPKARKDIPIASGFLDYFPDAVAAVAFLSQVANERHNPGQPLHWSRGKSNDHADTLQRHFSERGAFFTEKFRGEPVQIRHSTAMAWRAMAILQEELEAAGAPLARGARLPTPVMSGPEKSWKPEHDHELNLVTNRCTAKAPSSANEYSTATERCSLAKGHDGPHSA